MTHRFLFMARIHRWLDRNKYHFVTIPQTGWTIHQINQDYRDRRYYQINRGNG